MEYFNIKFDAKTRRMPALFTCSARYSASVVSQTSKIIHYFMRAHICTYSKIDIMKSLSEVKHITIHRRFNPGKAHIVFYHIRTELNYRPVLETLPQAREFVCWAISNYSMPLWLILAQINSSSWVFPIMYVFVVTFFFFL